MNFEKSYGTNSPHSALTALLGHMPSSVAFAARPDEQAEEVARDKLASEAYRWADAMLKARAQ